MRPMVLSDVCIASDICGGKQLIAMPLWYPKTLSESAVIAQEGVKF